MDNRRVAKAYRDRSLRAKVLPYPTPTGILSKVKRYFSGPAISHQTVEPSSHTRHASESSSQPALPSSVNTSLVNNSTDQADSNRILSSFFQEKGSDPLSQVEYEGVLSLMERSRANISVADTSAQPPRQDDSQVSLSRRNSHYSQQVLRNSSMLDGHTASYVAPDYKPVYHTFSENSPNLSRSSNVSTKRVYQFSGLPSPYRTRIRAPNTAARQTRRISAKLPVASVSETTANSTLESSTTFKPKSKTANSLLSILDGNSADTTSTTPVSTARPLHNPYLKGKRYLSSHSSESPPVKKPTTTADDIAKTASYTNVEALAEEKGPSLFDKSTATTDKSSSTENGTTSDVSNLKAGANGPSEVPSTSRSAEEPKKASNIDIKSTKDFSSSSKESQSSAPAFSFGANSSNSTEIKPTFSFGKPASEDSNDDSNRALSSNFGTSNSAGSDKTSSAFGTKPTDSSSIFNFGSKPESSASTFKFGIKPSESTKAAEPVDSDKKSTSEPSSGGNSKLFNLGATAHGPNFGEQKPFSSGKIEASAKTNPEKSSTSIFNSVATSVGSVSNDGAKISEPSAAGKPSETTSSFGSGPKVAEPKPSFSFGSKPVDFAGEKPASSFEPKQDESKPFSFATKGQQFKPFPGSGKEDPKPFSFGEKPEESNSSSAETKPEEPKPFSFGTKPEGPKPFNFGTKPEEPKPFSFGTKSAEPKSVNSEDKSEQPKPFSFGAKPEESKPFSFEARPEDSKPFSFEARPEDSKPFSFEARPEESKPFSFGAKPEESKPFSFGAKPEGSKSVNSEDKPEQPKLFSFGAKPEESKPFSFGAKPISFGENKQPAFSFGTKPKEPESSKTNTTENPSAEAKPSSLFGNSTSAAKPDFSFAQAKDSSKPLAAFDPSIKPAFSFGKAEEKKPSVSGESAESAKPVFNFGSLGSNGSSGLNGSNGPPGLNGQSGSSASHGSSATKEIQEFKFPSVEVKPLALDEAKVKEYEKLFDFP